MKLKFKTQAYQTAAVQAVVDCFIGQPPANKQASSYRIDPGNADAAQKSMIVADGFKNANLKLADTTLLDNIRKVQRRQNLPISEALADTKVCRVNLDVEMETGTGKTYCYIKTIFELNQAYGWSKFIIVVPSIAIREGVAKSLEITAEHFLESYHKKARFFIYNSKALHHLESFSSDAGINVMVINVQAFNATGKDARRIYEELDDFQSRKPIDVISANRPILILDEPQKLEGAKTLDSLKNFRPLLMLRYSATHKTTHNKIHRLDALDAYQQKLVKKIGVRGIAVKGLAGTNAYLYLQSIEISTTRPPEARLEYEQQLKTGEIKRSTRKFSRADNLFDLSNQLDQYKGFVVADIDAVEDTVSFTNGIKLFVGDATGDVNESSLRRIQIREAIKAHLEKEQMLFAQGIKVLTLFFIDEVAKYRDYTAPDEKGEYAHMFEEEYAEQTQGQADLIETPWQTWLKKIVPGQTHKGYFSIDKKTKRLINPEMGKRATEADDVDAYDLILKDKERLLSREEKTRFIFSHSALREGWDNPNVFVICTLKHSDNTTVRRQEVGRGLRLAVNQFGERMDDPATVHDINHLTVVANESYQDFVDKLQKEIGDSLTERPKVADADFFTGKVLITPDGELEITPQIARVIYKYLNKNDYVDNNDHIADAYLDAKRDGTLAPLPEELQPFCEPLFVLVDSAYIGKEAMQVADDRRPKHNPRNANFEKQEFKELWQRINHKAAYSVHFDTAELVRKAVATLDAKLVVAPLQYTIQSGEQNTEADFDALKSGDMFALQETTVETSRQSVHSAVQYDLLGKVADGTQLTRRAVAEILTGLNAAVFGQFRSNPEDFIAKATRLINEQKATMVIEHLAYDLITERFDLDIFTASQGRQDFSNAGDKLKRHVYDYVITQSNIERQFVRELDTSNDVVVYAKLPGGFYIPTPVGNYNPDWAIAFRQGSVKHVYFVAETKGSMSSMDLRPLEATKIACARKFFEKINQDFAERNVLYDVVDSFGKLMELVK